MTKLIRLTRNCFASLAKRVLIDVANEERVYIGEFARLLEILTGDEDEYLADGAKEVNELAEATKGKEERM